MKHTIFALCSLVLTIGVSAQDPNFDPLGTRNMPKMVRVMVEFIEVPLPELTKLLAEPRTTTNDNDLRTAAGKLVELGIAKHAETQFVMARSGETAKTEGILEYIYPTEYDPAELPNEVNTGEVNENTIELFKNMLIPPTPTAFDTRPTGSSLEIQPQLDENDLLVNLQFEPELVAHVRNEIWAEWNGAQGEAHVKMPLFFTNRITTGLTVVNGQYCLVATNSMLGEDGTPDHQRKLLFFVRADVLTVGL